MIAGPVLYAVFVDARQFRMQFAEEYFQLWNSIIGLKDKTCWFCSDFLACWCGKVGVEVGGSQLEGWTKRVGFVVTFRLAGAGKSTLKLVVSLWGYDYPDMPGVWASDDQVWALSVRGAAMALHPVQYQPGQPH